MTGLELEVLTHEFYIVYLGAARLCLSAIAAASILVHGEA